MTHNSSMSMIIRILDWLFSLESLNMILKITLAKVRMFDIINSTSEKTL
jgi:hypothetical protein